MNSLNYALLAAFLTLVAAPAVNAASITSNPTVGWQNLYRDANGRFYEGDGSARLDATSAFQARALAANSSSRVESGFLLGSAVSFSLMDSGERSGLSQPLINRSFTSEEGPNSSQRTSASTSNSIVSEPAPPEVPSEMIAPQALFLSPVVSNIALSSNDTYDSEERKVVHMTKSLANGIAAWDLEALAIRLVDLENNLNLAAGPQLSYTTLPAANVVPPAAPASSESIASAVLAADSTVLVDDQQVSPAFVIPLFVGSNLLPASEAPVIPNVQINVSQSLSVALPVFSPSPTTVISAAEMFAGQSNPLQQVPTLENPEPGTFLLLSLAAPVLLFFKRRHKNS